MTNNNTNNALNGFLIEWIPAYAEELNIDLGDGSTLAKVEYFTITRNANTVNFQLNYYNKGSQVLDNAYYTTKEWYLVGLDNSEALEQASVMLNVKARDLLSALDAFTKAFDL